MVQTWCHSLPALIPTLNWWPLLVRCKRSWSIFYRNRKSWLHSRFESGNIPWLKCSKIITQLTKLRWMPTKDSSLFLPWFLYITKRLYIFIIDLFARPIPRSCRPSIWIFVWTAWNISPNYYSMYRHQKTLNISRRLLCTTHQSSMSRLLLPTTNWTR